MREYQGIRGAAGIPLRSQGPAVTSRDLLCGGRQLIIDHEGETYRLKLTRQGKLILTK